MCFVGQRRVTVRGAVDGSGAPVPLGLHGTVIGHVGQLAIVSLDSPDYEHVNVLIPDAAPGISGYPRRVEVAPAPEVGLPEVVRPSRGRERYRQRR